MAEMRTHLATERARLETLCLRVHAPQFYADKPAVRNFREGDGNVGIIRSPIRAIALPDRAFLFLESIR